MDTLRDAAGSAMDSFAQSLANAEGPLEALKAGLVDILQTIIRIAEQQAITRLFGASGTAGGGSSGILQRFVRPASAAWRRPRPPRRPVDERAYHRRAVAAAQPDITKSAQAAEERAIARGPVVARNNSLRYGIA